jgi:hypothetical protein
MNSLNLTKKVPEIRQCKCGKLVKNQKRCRDCRRQYDFQYYTTNQVQKSASATQRKRELMDWYKALKSGRSCVDCGTCYVACQLDFDHLPQFQKRDEVSHMVRTGLAKETIEAEVAKCQLVCKNCHALRTERRRK